MKISSPLPAKAQARFESLAREPDPELRARGLLHLAAQFGDESQFPAAREIYESLQANPEILESLRLESASRLALLGGQGPFGARFETWSRDFARHAVDPGNLAAMTAGGFAFRLARFTLASRLLSLPASPWTRGLAAKSLATLGGFGIEVLTFSAVARTLAPPHSLSWSQELAVGALSLGALKLSGAASQTLASRLLGPSAAGSGLGLRLFHNASLLGGILLGGELERAAGFREQGLDSWEALSTLLHFQVAGELSRRWLGKRFARAERRLDGQWTELSWNGGRTLGPRPAWAHAQGGSTPPRRDPAPHPGWLAVGRGGSESGLTPPILRNLEAKYLHRFPADERGYYSKEIVSRACRIRCDLPGFHENLLESLSMAPNRGQLGQLYTVLAIERIFSTDALSSARGSFDYAPLQLLLGNAMSETDSGRRIRQMRSILEIFERGFSRIDSVELLQKYTKLPFSDALDTPFYSETFRRRHGEEASRAWESYRPEDIVPLFNFVYKQASNHPEEASRLIETLGSGHGPASPYFTTEIAQVLDYARIHPYGDLVLKRLSHVFEAGDHPSKLAEISGERSKIPTDRYVEALVQNGHSNERIAEFLNGSQHTAHFNDMRLAEKVASVFREATPYLRRPQLREANRTRLVEHVLTQMAHLRYIQDIDLFGLLRIGHYPRAEFLEQAWRDGEFKIEILPYEDFRREVDAWGKVQDCEWSFFRQASGYGERDRIFIRQTPLMKVGTEAERDLAFSETVWRLRGLVHELEHWSHFRGRGPQGRIPAFQLQGISREERYITEIMAYLEEFRWRAMNSDDHYWQISKRLGDTLPLFLRNVAEDSYF